MVKVDSTIGLIGENGPVTLVNAFERRRLLIAYYWRESSSRLQTER